VNQFLSHGEDDESGYELLGKSPAMEQLRALIRKVARTQATVLIQGESGTGKELVARALYRQSPRATAPFIKLNCAAVPENLIESEFFGHEKGHLPARSTSAKAVLNSRTPEPFSWTRSAKFLRPCRRNCCGCCKSASSNAWAEIERSRSMCA
jgi:transcriptional regulator of aromatic amino acid metabolism